jgi:hypothetical protein
LFHFSFQVDPSAAGELARAADEGGKAIFPFTPQPMEGLKEVPPKMGQYFIANIFFLKNGSTLYDLNVNGHRCCAPIRVSFAAL